MLFKYSLYRKLVRLLTPLAYLLASSSVFAHSGPLNKIAVDVCSNKVKSQVCQYEGGHNDLYIGTCQYMAEDLICVRNQPIRKVDIKKGDTKHSEAEKTVDQHQHKTSDK